MNEQFARALGIDFLKKGKAGGAAANGCGVHVTKSKTVYRFSFSLANGKKIGEYVRVAKANGRIYFDPVKGNDEFSFKVYRPTTEDTTHGARPSIQVAFKVIGNIDEFVGRHELKFFPDLGAYYITTKKMDK